MSRMQFGTCQNLTMSKRLLLLTEGILPFLKDIPRDFTGSSAPFEKKKILRTSSSCLPTSFFFSVYGLITRRNVGVSTSLGLSVCTCLLPLSSWVASVVTQESEETLAVVIGWLAN